MSPKPQTSDDESDTGTARLSELLWHNIKKKPKKICSPRPNQASEELKNQTRTSQVNTSSLSTDSATKSTDSTTVSRSAHDIQKLVSKLTKEAEGPKKKSIDQPKLTSTVSAQTMIDIKVENALKDVKSADAPKSKRQKKRDAKLAKSQWSWGQGTWGSMKVTEMTDEKKNDLMILNMRSTINPTRHYKHSDVKTPKFFQIGTVVDDAYHFHDRIPKKKRKRTLVDELMADDEFNRKLKKQYNDIKHVTSSRKAVFQGKAPRKIKKIKKRKK